MIFNSIDFLIFFPIVVILNYTVPTKYRWIPLLIASYYFYMSWNPALVFLILFTTAASYAASHIIERTDNKRMKQLCLALTLIICLGVLFFFKYFNFLSTSVNALTRLFGGSSDPFILNLILPVGISFYTFQTLSYVIDVYRGDVKAEPHFGYYMLYVSYFPQLVAGPIERPENLIPQLHEPHKWDFDMAASGLKKMVCGFFKKVVIADLAAQYVNAVYNAPQEANGISVTVATLLFAVQIYCDFSGYTDIAIGAAEVMGIRLMQNFNRPYIATSIKDFWARWHISLSTWFRDYLYIPLGGNRKGYVRQLINLMIVFLVSGLWHGAAWTFVLWGALHGTYQVIGSLTLKSRKRLWERLHIDPQAKWFVLLRRFITFMLVCFAWIFFRANSISDLGVLLGKLFGDWSFSAAFVRDTFSAIGLPLIMLVILLLSTVIMSRMDEDGNTAIIDSEGSGIAALRSSRYAYAVWVIAAAWLVLLCGDGSSAFIYFQF